MRESQVEVSLIDKKISAATVHLRTLRDTLREARRKLNSSIKLDEKYVEEEVGRMLSGSKHEGRPKWLADYVKNMSTEDMKTWKEGIYPDSLSNAIMKHNREFEALLNGVREMAAFSNREIDAEMDNVLMPLVDQEGHNQELLAQIGARLKVVPDVYDDGDGRYPMYYHNLVKAFNAQIEARMSSDGEYGDGSDAHDEEIISDLNRGLPHKWNALCEAYRQAENRVYELKNFKLQNERD